MWRSSRQQQEQSARVNKLLSGWGGVDFCGAAHVLVQSSRSFRTHVDLRCHKRDEQQQRTLASILSDRDGVVVMRPSHWASEMSTRSIRWRAVSMSSRCEASPDGRNAQRKLTGQLHLHI